MSDTRARHPSGRPIRRDEKRERGYWNTPNSGPVVPRLRDEKKDLQLVGFHHEAISELDERED